ncbi:hypothetical protein P7D22_10875 [Lichenihabitans sp. Uapishka_5]|uniref:hypothetical protein n=1 Tax=Lichenihabitans sp. Uapishka_5 TaxID=3037302 RepID=UPI0029E7F684|nr:hypothetical protein [Lichenihabitans sp. Uapishka_5]MDX7951670.1 hypothetical protein [Lichenihabitans sp. Uapishka_5]
MTLFRTFCTAGLLLSAAVAPALAAGPQAPTAEDKLQAACYPDVEKLCKDAMPDEAKVAACMKQHKSEISAKCEAAYKESGRTD